MRDDYKITRDHTRLLTVHQDKDYRIVFDTRVVMQDYSTDFKRVLSPVMADIWKQIIPAIEQKKPELRQLVPLYNPCCSPA
jgi:hypothetical protein